MRRGSAIAPWIGLLAAVASAADLTFSVSTSGWPDDARRQAAVDAIDAVVARFNAYGDFTRGNDGNVEVVYGSGTPTADAGYNGRIRFGGTYPNQRVTQHELNHWLGSATVSQWGATFSGGVWTGPKVNAVYRMLNGDAAVLRQSGVHFYGYGLNYDSEVTNANVLPANVAIMYAMRQDMGIGVQADPWTAAGRSRTVTLRQSDALGRSGFNWFDAWDDGYYAHAGADYATANHLLRTPAGPGDASTGASTATPSFTFAGDSLTIANTNGISGGLLYKGIGTSGRLTFANLILAGGYVRHSSGPGDLCRLAGLVTVAPAAAPATIHADQGHIEIEAALAGTGRLSIPADPSGFFVRLGSAANTFTGSIDVGGRLELRPGAVQRFVIGESGACNSISGSGPQVLLGGIFDFDLTGAARSPGGSWTVVSATNASYADTFAINGFSFDAGRWRSRSGFAFSPATGTLTFAAPPAAASWNGGSASWTADGNWSAPIAAGQRLAFGPAQAAATTLTNDRPAAGGLDVAGITFLATAPAYTLDPGPGNTTGIRLSAGIVNQSGRPQTINDRLALPFAGTLFATSGGGGDLLVTAVVTGPGGLTKAGAGRLTLSGASSFTGATRVEAGELLLTGSLHPGGSLAMAGGRFTLGRPGSQAVAGLTLLPGLATLEAVAGGTLSLGAITRTKGAAVAFDLAGGVITTSAAPVDGILGPWAVVGSGSEARFATTVAGRIAGFSNATPAADFGYASDPSANYEVAGVGGQLGIPRVVNTVRYVGAAATVTTNSNQTFGFNALMNAGTGTLTLGSGAFAYRVTAGSTGELLLIAASADIVVSHSLNDGEHGTDLIVMGPRMVTLRGGNGFTGQTRVGSGTLAVVGGAALPDAGLVSLAADATLALGSSETIGGLTGSGRVVIGGTLSVGASGPSTEFSGQISGPGSLEKIGGGSLRLTAANSFAGRTVVRGGELILDHPQALEQSAVGIAAGGTLTIAEALAAPLRALAIDGGRLEVGPHGVAIAAGGFSAEAIRAALVAGRNGGGWDGPRGITSATAATAAGSWTLGYTIAGTGVATVAVAAPGDTDLDGSVNVFDLVTISSAGLYGTNAPASWQTGDFDYDGVATLFDLVAIDVAGGYNRGHAGGAWPAPVGLTAAAVPEPGLWHVLLATLGGALGRARAVGRRKRRRELAIDRLEPRRVLAGDLDGFSGPLEPPIAEPDALAADVAASAPVAAAAGSLFGLGLPDLRGQAVLSLHDQVQTHATLADTVVTMTGKSELWITGTTSPVTGSTFHLDSEDAWLFFSGIRPAVVNSTYLGQVRVGGRAAVHDSTVRVVQYGTGTVVIPHAPSYRPLEVFAGPNFTGQSAAFGQYTYHDAPATLGSMQGAISSFRLARGYMATFATQANGSGRSKVYVAQDHDLDISYLPAELDNAVQFVRVLPWRWVSKKGASDLGADPLAAAWRYNWNNNLESTLDWEYVPIRQQRYWPAMPTSKTNVTHILGFNEPDNPVEDAYQSLGNGSVDAAIAFWPQMLSSGLRVGSPAVTDGGKAWLYEFMDKAIAANLRVDYIAIHNYQANHTASSLSAWLKDIYDRYRLPIWVTEFNNGANWTTAPDPTLQQNASWVASITEMFDTTPWIERYSIYSNVEDVRKMIDSSGNLTPAGVVYRDNASPIGYVQDLEAAAATAGRRVTRLAFDGDTADSSGHGNNGQLAGAAQFVTGRQGQALQFDGISSQVRLPANVVGGSAFSFAAWVKWDGGSSWQRIFDFGSSTSSYLFLTPSNGSVLRFGIRSGGTEQRVETAPLAAGQWTHLAVTLGGGVARLYVNGTQAGVNAAVTITPGSIAPTRNLLGESQGGNRLFRGSLDEVLITDTALTAAQVAGLAASRAPRFTSPALVAAAANRGVPFAGSLVGQAGDPDGEPLTFAKASGPAWLSVSADGSYSGTLPASASGAQEFVVTATDSTGAVGSATLFVPVAEVYWRGDMNGVWTTASGGNTNWATDPAGVIEAGTLPDAATDVIFAAGSAANLPSVTLGADVAVRGLRVTASSGVTLRGTTNLTLGAGGLALDPGSGAGSILTTGQVILAAAQTWALANDLTVTSAITGGGSLSKTGSGTMQVLGANTFTGGTTIAAGTFRIGNGGTTGSIVGDVVNDGALVVDRSTELTLTGRISGTGSLTKWSGGRLVLASSSSYSGGTTIGSDAGPGVVRATATSALGSGQVLIGPNGNTTTARLELAGDISLTNPVRLPLRTNGTAAIQNVSGTNALAGTITLAVGGSAAVIQSDAGRLTLAGITSAAGGSRTVTLQGSGDGRIAGVVSNGSGTVGLAKAGLGTWTLAAANSYSGDTTVSAGTLAIDGDHRIPDASALVLGGGTFATGGFSETVASLSLLGDSTIDLGAGASLVRATAVGTFGAGRSLAIVNWTPDADRVFIGSTASLTPDQLSRITINGLAVEQTASGEIVPVAVVDPDAVFDVAAGQQASPPAQAGAGRLIKRGAGLLVLEQANTHSGGTIVEAGTVEIRNVAALGSGPLEVRAGATVRLDVGLSSVPLAQLDLAAGAVLDIGAGGLEIAAGGADEAALRGWILAGRGGGSWLGSGGIRSAAAAAASGSRSIGYAVRPDGSVRVIFTAIGDLDLDRDVDVFDLIGMDAAGRYGSGQPAGWAQGDVTYDGQATVFDLVGIDSAGTYGAGSIGGMTLVATAPAAAWSPGGGDLDAARLTAFGRLAVNELFATETDEEDEASRIG